MNSMWKSILGLGLTIGLFVIVPAHAAIIYVDKDNACPGSGTAASPYCSIQNAFDLVNAGDTIRIRDAASPYDANSVLTRSGSNSNPITIEPDTGNAPTIRYTGNGAQAAAIELRDVSYVTVQNLTFDGAGVHTSAYGLYVHATKNDMNGIQILNNTIKNWGGNTSQASFGTTRGPLAIDGGYCPSPCSPERQPRGTIVRGNTFDSNRQVNIFILHASDTLIENNTITNTKCGKDNDTGRSTIGIKLDDARDNGSSGTIIRGNTIHDFEPTNSCGVGHTSGAYDSWPGIWCDVGPWNGRIENNTIYNINNGLLSDFATYESQGIFIEAGCSGWVVRNNVVYNIGDAGVRQRMARSGQTANQYLNNTIYNVGGNGFEGGNTGSGTGAMVIKNNIVYNAGNAQIHFDTADAGLHTIN